MLLTQQWVQFFSSKLVKIRARLPSTRSYNPVIHATVSLNARFLPLTLPPSTLGILSSPQLPHPHRPQAPHLWSVKEFRRLSPWQIRHLDYTSQFTSDIRHIQGSRNAAADALSRIHLETNALLNSSQAIDFSVIATAQHNDPELRN